MGKYACVSICTLIASSLFTGRTTVLTQAYPRSVHEPGLYATVRIHAEATPNETQQQRKDFSVSLLTEWLILRVPAGNLSTPYI